MSRTRFFRSWLLRAVKSGLCLYLRGDRLNDVARKSILTPYLTRFLDSAVRNDSEDANTPFSSHGEPCSRTVWPEASLKDASRLGVSTGKRRGGNVGYEAAFDISSARAVLIDCDVRGKKMLRVSENKDFGRDDLRSSWKKKRKNLPHSNPINGTRSFWHLERASSDEKLIRKVQYSHSSFFLCLPDYDKGFFVIRAVQRARSVSRGGLSGITRPKEFHTAW